MRMSPSLIDSWPAIIRNVDVLPQPDGPSRQQYWPPGIRKSIESTASESPYCFDTCTSSISAGSVLSTAEVDGLMGTNSCRASPWIRARRSNTAARYLRDSQCKTYANLLTYRSLYAHHHPY